MPYGTFAVVPEVARIFDITVSRNTSFVDTLKMEVPEHDFWKIKKKLADSLNFINETTVCERVISPILELISDNYTSLRIWSHVPYDVDKEKGLTGEPDYLIAPVTKYGDMGVPPLCIVEAKRDDFEGGWTQALAEMVAASLQGRKICYSVVTTGKTWEFGKLENQVFIKDHRRFSATENLQEIFDILNWTFHVAESSLGTDEC